MKSRLSALIDGAIDESESESLFNALRRTEELRECGHLYPLIGDALRGESVLAIDMTTAVMKRLEAEPSLVVRRRSAPWRRPVLAIAASLAGVATVAWLALPLARQVPETSLAARSAPAEVMARKDETIKPEAAGDMQDYLIAHQSQAVNPQFMGGSAHIRTVSYNAGN